MYHATGEDMIYDIYDGGFLGYMEECENYILLDRVVDVINAYDGEDISFEEACIEANVDPDTISYEDRKYIERKLLPWA